MGRVNDFLTSGSSRRPAIMMTAALTIAVLAAAISLVLARTGDSATPGATAQPSATVTPTATLTPSVTQTDTVPTAPLKLPTATKRVSGVAIGYPRSSAGAVAAAIEFSAATATLDPDRAAAVGRLIADPAWTTGPEDFAAGAASSRKRLGLPAGSALTSEAAIAVEPAQYQVRDADSDRVLVLLLSYLTTTSPAQGTQTRVIVLPCPMHWTGSDWRLEKAGDADYTDFQATPGTSEAAGVGWLDFRR
jgi:hypothetical protein